MLEKESTLDDYIEDEVDKETGTTKEEDAEILCAMNPDEIYSYVPKRFRGLPTGQQPIFKLKILSSREAAELENNSVNATTRGDKRQVMRVMGGSTTLKALEMGCRGWENWNYKNGEPATFRENNGKPRPDTFDCVPGPIRQELAKVITTGQGLSEQAEKNSESQSPGS